MAELEIVAEGLRFPEGPVAMPDGSVILVEIAAGRITRVRPDGARRSSPSPATARTASRSGRTASSIAVNNGGFSWIEARARCARTAPPPIMKAAGSSASTSPPARSRRSTASGDHGVALRGPNDIVFDAHGGFYFTDLGKMRERDRDTTGLFYAKADGSFIAEVVHPLDAPTASASRPTARRSMPPRPSALPALGLRRSRRRAGSARRGHLYRPGGLHLFRQPRGRGERQYLRRHPRRGRDFGGFARGRAGRIRADARFLHHQHRLRRARTCAPPGSPCPRAAGWSQMHWPRPGFAWPTDRRVGLT